MVRTFKQRRRNIVARAHHPDHRPLDCHNPKPFWISWADGVFQVGSGLTVGTGRFLSYNSQSTPIVRSVAVSTGFGSTGTWTFGKLNSSTFCNHTYNSEPPSDRQQNAIRMAFRRCADSGMRWCAFDRGQRFLNI